MWVARAVAKTLAKEGGITAAELCVELRCVAPGGVWAVSPPKRVHAHAPTHTACSAPYYISIAMHFHPLPVPPPATGEHVAGAPQVDTQETCSITRPVKEYQLGDRLHTTSAYHHKHLAASRVPCADGWSEPQPGPCRPQYGVRSVCLILEPSERAEPRGRGRSLADGAERHPALRAV